MKAGDANEAATGESGAPGTGAGTGASSESGAGEECTGDEQEEVECEKDLETLVQSLNRDYNHVSMCWEFLSKTMDWKMISTSSGDLKSGWVFVRGEQGKKTHRAIYKGGKDGQDFFRSHDAVWSFVKNDEALLRGYCATKSRRT